MYPGACTMRVPPVAAESRESDLESDALSFSRFGRVGDADGVAHRPSRLESDVLYARTSLRSPWTQASFGARHNTRMATHTATQQTRCTLSN